jgi:hypothetical protein
MRKAIYTVNISDEQNAEKILEDIDRFFIKLEHKYTDVQVET